MTPDLPKRGSQIAICIHVNDDVRGHLSFEDTFNELTREIIHKTTLRKFNPERYSYVLVIEGDPSVTDPFSLRGGIEGGGGVLFSNMTRPCRHNFESLYAFRDRRLATAAAESLEFTEGLTTVMVGPISDIEFSG